MKIYIRGDDEYEGLNILLVTLDRDKAFTYIPEDYVTDNYFSGQIVLVYEESNGGEFAIEQWKWFGIKGWVKVYEK